MSAASTTSNSVERYAGRGACPVELYCGDVCTALVGHVEVCVQVDCEVREERDELCNGDA
jgi:hypothetical protein